MTDLPQGYDAARIAGWIEPVRRAVAARESELIAVRRQLHMQPELSFQEHRSTELVAERLRIAGLAPRVLDIGTGVVCDIGDTSDSYVVLRADLDALAMSDRKDVAYRSRSAGVAHACGHDAHTAIVLGAGLALHELLQDRSLLPLAPAGGVRLVFEPGEEQVPGGAVDVIRAGWIDGARAIYGVHCDPKLDVGIVGLRKGPITSASDLLRITLNGPGGHTARPSLTVDLVRVAADIVRELPEQVAVAAEKLGSVSVVFGSLHTGDAPNVIPAHAELAATVRTPDMAVWAEARDLVAETIDKLIAGTGAHVELQHIRGVPPVVNDADEASLMAAVVEAAEGRDCVVPTQQSLGGDSFAWYLQQIPGAYARLGVHDPQGSRRRLDLHAADFDLDERAIPLGSRALALTALAALTATHR